MICNVQVHTVGAVDHDKESEAGERLIKGLNSLVQLDRWKQNDGADFVYYDPHPGFTDGTADVKFKNYVCDVMKHSMHIVVERGQRNICKVRACCGDMLPCARRDTWRQQQLTELSSRKDFCACRICLKRSSMRESSGPGLYYVPFHTAVKT